MTRFTARLIQAAAVAAVLVSAPAIAHAADYADAGGLSVRIKLDEVRTPTGVAAARRHIDSVADGFCRSHPVGATIADCKIEVTEQLTQHLDRQVQLALRSQRPTVLARR